MPDHPSQPQAAAAAQTIVACGPKRALAEAEARRAAAAQAKPQPAAKEFQGPEGPEPTRYGDWEKQGHRLGFLRDLAIAPAIFLWK